MPNCNSNVIGFERSCESIASGVKNLWIASFSAGTVWDSAADGSITGATGAPTFYPVEIRESTCQFAEELVVNAQYGSKNVRQNFTLEILGGSQSARTFTNTILTSRMVLVSETEDGNFILAGESKALEVTAGGSTTGIQAGEKHALTLTVSGLAADFAPTLSDAYATTLLSL